MKYKKSVCDLTQGIYGQDYLERSELHRACRGCFHESERISYGRQSVWIDCGNGQHAYELVDLLDFDLEHWVRLFYEQGTEESARIETTITKIIVNVPFSGKKLIENRKKKSEEFHNAIQTELKREMKLNAWNDGIQWARENGAEIRSGKISRDLAIYRIYVAGLMEEFGSRFPDYAFTAEDVEMAVSRLKEKDQMYSERKTYDKSTGKWVYKSRPKREYPMEIVQKK